MGGDLRDWPYLGKNSRDPRPCADCEGDWRRTLSTDFVVTPAVDGALVSRLQGMYRLHFWALGHSTLDLPMLRQADNAFVVVGRENEPSESMELNILTAIDAGGLQACQILLPPTVTPRLDHSRLPLASLADDRLIESIFRRGASRAVIRATAKDAAKPLMTPMRDARIAAPDLRERHRLCGMYLAIEYLSENRSRRVGHSPRTRAFHNRPTSFPRARNDNHRADAWW